MLGLMFGHPEGKVRQEEEKGDDGETTESRPKLLPIHDNTSMYPEKARGPGLAAPLLDHACDVTLTYFHITTKSPGC